MFEILKKTLGILIILLFLGGLNFLLATSLDIKFVKAIPYFSLVLIISFIIVVLTNFVVFLFS